MDTDNANNNDYKTFLSTFDSPNTAKVARSVSKIGEYDYAHVTPLDVEQIILDMKPNSPKAITTIAYFISLYAKHIGNDTLYHIAKDIDRNAIWSMAKPIASKKFISHSRFMETYNDIEMYEDYNAMYQQTLFKCLYEGIYCDDMSVLKNLRASDVDVNNDKVNLRKDSGETYELEISNRLAEDLVKLGSVDIWERNNRFGTCKINTKGLHEASCFKVENRKGSKEYSYRYTYYRILRKISKEYLHYNLLPLQLYVSGIMHRIELDLNEHGISLEEAFALKNRDRLVAKIISDELVRCHCNTEVKNFREMVIGHLDVWLEKKPSK